MAFTEDLSIFLSTSDFAVPVVAGAILGLCILDMPSEIIADGVVFTLLFQVIHAVSSRVAAVPWILALNPK